MPETVSGVRMFIMHSKNDARLSYTFNNVKPASNYKLGASPDIIDADGDAIFVEEALGRVQK